MTHRSASRYIFATHPTCYLHWPLFSRPAPHVAGSELGLFSCSIPSWFVLSNNLSTTNTRAIWLCFGAFLSPPYSPFRFHWPQTTDYWSLFSCHWPLFSRHSPLPSKTLPRWLLPDTNRRIAEDRMGPISTSGPSILLCAEPGDSCGKSNPFLPPTRRRPTVDHSLAAGDAQRQWLQGSIKFAENGFSEKTAWHPCVESFGKGKGVARITDVVVANVGGNEPGLDHPAMFPLTLAEQLVKWKRANALGCEGMRAS